MGPSSLRFLIATVALASGRPAAADAPPTPPSGLYRGFPCYPPEALPDARASEDEVRLSLRHRADAVRHLAQLKTPSDLISDPILKQVMDEFAEALHYLQTQADAQGWKLIESTFMLDGGSQVRRFARRTPDGLDEVTATVWSGMVTLSRGSHASASPGGRWGYVTYAFTHLPPPALVAGFPLYLAPPGVAASAKMAKGETVLDYTLTDPRSGVRDDLLALAAFEGWTRRFSPVLTTNEALFALGPQPALLKVAGTRVTLHLPSPIMAAELLASYPEEVARGEEIGAGCFIRDGRFVRRPYRVMLGNHVLSLNGEPLETFKVGPEMPELRRFENLARGLRTGDVEVESPDGKVAFVSGSHTEDEIQALLARIDEVLAEPGSKDVKMALFARDEGLKRFFRDPKLAEAVIDHWDGSN